MRSINKGLTEETAVTPGATMAGRSESQSADLFQELQREVEKVNAWMINTYRHVCMYLC